MKVLVTGATGFVGGHLVERLLTRGDSVTAIVRDAGRARGLARRGVRVVEGRLDDPAAIGAVTRGQDVVYHVAGLVAARSEAEFLATNRDGAGHVARAADQAGVSRLVLVSSLAAAGPTNPGQPLRGTEPGQPVTLYGKSKLAGEEAVRAASTPWTIVRPPGVYGPGDREMLRLFKAAALGLAPVFGDGSQQLSWVYAPDLADALVAAALSPHTVRGCYYACHPEVVTSRELVLRIGAAVGKRPLVFGLPAPLARAILRVTDTAARLTGKATLLSVDKAAEFLAPAWLADPGPLTEATGWRAEHDLSAGTAATVRWYREQGWL